MLSLVISTVAFFVAAYFINRYLNGMDIPNGMTRSIVVFTLALAISYGVALVVEWIAP
jgi:hypothetical protein